MKNFWKIVITMVLTALVFTGCGAAENTEEKPETSAAAETETTEEATETPDETEELAPDPTNLTCLAEYQIKDSVSDDGKKYAFYAPKGGQIMEEWFYNFDDHGVSFSASVFPGGSLENLQKFLEDKAGLTAEVWQEDPECSEIAVGEVQKKGDDRYLFLTAQDKDSHGMTYQRTQLYYVSVRDGGVGVFWDMEVRENERDEETASLIDEVARCYGLDLSKFAMEDGTWAEQAEQRKEQEMQRQVDAQDIYEPREGDSVLEKAEGYQYLGKTMITFDEEEGITGSVLVPMGYSTSASERDVSTIMHGVKVRADVDYTYKDFYENAQEKADKDLEYYSDPGRENRNVHVSEVTPIEGEEPGAFYVLEYEEQDYRSGEYYERADVILMIHVEEQYFVNYRISLMSVDYDSATNDLIGELETAYGLDLSKWYAKE